MSNPQNSIGREYCSHFVRKETEAQLGLFLMPRVAKWRDVLHAEVKQVGSQFGFPAY